MTTNAVMKFIKNWVEYDIYASGGASVNTATSSTAWIVKLGSDTMQTVAAWTPSATSWKSYAIQTNSAWQMVVNVPRTDTTYSQGTWISISWTTISNSWVTSVNGNTWTVTVSEFSPWSWTTGQVVTKTANGYGYANIPSQVSDTAYASSWDWVTTTAPSKNAVYDKINSVDSSISTINWKIPSAATSSNQLADKNYVNDSINSVTAYYITKDAQWNQFATYAQLAAATTFYSGWEVRIPTKNDYTIVLADENHDNATTRYIYNSGWEYQYTINETAMTQAQLDALNSGITSSKVTTYDGYATWKQDTLISGTSIKTVNSTSLLWSGDVSINEVPSWWTEWQVLTKWASWYSWANAASWWITNDTTGTTTTVSKIRAWTEAEYEGLSTKDENTIYYTF